MSLREYERKRAFNRTPEPKEKKEGIGESDLPIFVVQKHAATSTHYDFRLEHKGALISWAVPKGFPKAPLEKRLASKVEDHPFSYKDFEGVIPEGNYGAGAVIVWDQGYFFCDGERDKKTIEKRLEAGLKNGHFSFSLVGQKLYGSFAMAKLCSKENDWLLFAKKENFSEEKGSYNDNSVFSGLSVEEVREGKLAPMPHEIMPMMAYSTDRAFNREGWIFEIKWDGYRAIAEVADHKVSLYSRNLVSYNEKFSAIAEELKKISGSYVLDGEIVVLDDDGSPNFQALQDYSKSKKGEIRYYVFDLLYSNGRNLMSSPLIRRKELLKKFLPENNLIKYCDHVANDGVNFFNAAISLEIEGMMAKDGESPYLPGRRSKSWLKVKKGETMEAVIAGFTLPQSGRKYFSSLILGAYQNGELIFIGHVGTGFDDKKLKNLSEKFIPLAQEKSPFSAKVPLNAPAVWLRPGLVCSVRFAERTKEGILRQPVFLHLRDDINPKDVTYEQ